MEVTEALQKCVPGGGICRQRCLWRRGEQCFWGGVNLWRGVDRNEFRVANCKPETERSQFREHLACSWPGSHQAMWGNWVDLPLLPVKELHMDDCGYSLPGSSARTLQAVLESSLRHPRDEMRKAPRVAHPLDSRWLTCLTGMMPWVLGKQTLPSSQYPWQPRSSITTLFLGHFRWNLRSLSWCLPSPVQSDPWTSPALTMSPTASLRLYPSAFSCLLHWVCALPHCSGCVPAGLALCLLWSLSLPETFSTSSNSHPWHAHMNSNLMLNFKILSCSGRRPEFCSQHLCQMTHNCF